MAGPAVAAEPALFNFCPDGVGTGQCNNPRGVAANPQTGHVYVSEVGNNRVSEFNALGQFVRAWGSGVTSSGATGTGNVSAGSKEVKGTVTTSRAFLAGQRISGIGIAAGTTIVKVVNGGIIELSQAATSSGSGIALTAPIGTGNVAQNEVQRVTLSAGVTGGNFKLSFSTPAPDNTTAAANTTVNIPFNASPAEVDAALEALGNVGAGNVSVTSPNPGGGAAPGGPYAVEFTGTRFADTNVSQLGTAAGSPPLSGGSVSVATTQHGTDVLEVCAADCVVGGFTATAGGFKNPIGTAVDSSGNVYIIDLGNLRVQKFSPKGNFLLMFGGEVNKTTGENVCTKADLEALEVCGAGTGGGGAGQFVLGWEARSNIAIDASGNVWVGDDNRIQRFNTGGVYQGEIAIPGESVESLAVDTAGDLYAIYRFKGAEGIHKLSPTGTPLATFKALTPGGKDDPLAAVAVNVAGHVFAFGLVEEPGGGSTPLIDPVVEFDAAGNVVNRFGKGEFTASTAIGTNLCKGSEAPGNVYVSNFTPGKGIIRAYGSNPVGCFKARTFPATNIEEATATLSGTVNPDGSVVSECRFEYGTSTTYGQVAPCVPGAGELGAGTSPVPVHASLSSLAAGTVYHFRLLAVVGGETETGADEEFKTKGPPVISVEHVAGATSTEATIKALVNPEGLATSYHCEYGLDETYAQSTSPVAIGSARSNIAALCNLKGLTPDTTYHWRVLATNSSGTSLGKGHTLSTYLFAEEVQSCPNDSQRGGPSAFLPDCRAYEMVSPIEKNGGDIYSLEDEYVQASANGDSLTYTTIPSFAGQPNAFTQNQYLARRGSGGWSNEGVHPPVAGATATTFLMGVVREFMAFTPDLCDAWLVDPQGPPPTADGQAGNVNLYRRVSCAPGVGGLEALVPAPPALPAGTGQDYVGNTSIGGVSDDGSHALFAAEAKLTKDASAALNLGNGFPVAQVYDRFEGALSLTSVLPNGSAGDPVPGDGQGFADPSGSGVGSGWARNLEGAVSGDGARVYWTSGFTPSSGAGKIYLRLHPEQGIVAGECTGAGAACTVPVSSGGGAFFWAASPDGSKALISEEGLSGGENLSEFSLTRAEAKEPALQSVVKGIDGLLGWSKDLSRVYFTSESVLAGSGANGEGDKAVAGGTNLYLAEGGAFSFVATLIPGDVGAKEPGGLLVPYDLSSRAAEFRATRTSADGGELAFESRAQLTDFDNTVSDGKAAVEVYLYDAVAGKLHCVSCNPSGAQPEGRELKQSFNRDDQRPTNVTAAAWIPTHQQPLHASNVLSADGGRLFFNSNDSLLPRDVNGAQDVYEWEAPGVGSCKEASSSYFPQNGGCLYLISTGESTYESEFREASSDGRDVFFSTDSRLVPQDPGLIDLYDARVGGGFPQSAEEVECEGEACQSPPPAPELPAPASDSFEGPGNVKPGRCPKGKHRVSKGGKAHCAKKKRAQHKRRAAR